MVGSASAFLPAPAPGICFGGWPVATRSRSPWTSIQAPKALSSTLGKAGRAHETRDASDISIRSKSDASNVTGCPHWGFEGIDRKKESLDFVSGPLTSKISCVGPLSKHSAESYSVPGSSKDDDICDTRYCHVIITYYNYIENNCVCLIIVSCFWISIKFFLFLFNQFFQGRPHRVDR